MILKLLRVLHAANSTEVSLARFVDFFLKYAQVGLELHSQSWLQKTELL